MVMTHMYPGEGTWNIRLWRSADHPGIYSLELQDPKAGGVQSAPLAMRFPSPEYAHSWLSRFATVTTRIEDFAKGSYLTATGESSVWHPIVIALYHSAGPKELFYDSMWYHGSPTPVVSRDPLAEVEHRSADWAAMENVGRPQEGWSLHYLPGVTNVFALHRFTHVHGRMVHSEWRVKGQWHESAPVEEPKWKNAFRDLVRSRRSEARQLGDATRNSNNPRDLVKYSKSVEIDARIADDVIRLFDLIDEIPDFVAEFVNRGADSNIEFLEVSEHEQRYFLQLEYVLRTIDEEFMEPPGFLAFLAFLDGGHIRVSMMIYVMVLCAEWERDNKLS